MKDKYLRIMLVLTPAILRRGILICIYRAIAEAIKGIHERYEVFQGEVNLRLSYTGQVYSLIKLIKDNVGINFEIIDLTESKTILLYRENAEGQVEQVILTEKDAEYLIYKEGKSELAGYGFAVIISKSDSEYEDRVCDLIDKYRLAGKQYKVIYKD